MKYVYPAIFTPVDGGYDVHVPDLPGCRTFGEDIAEAIEMAEDAVSMWLWDAEKENEDIPLPSENLKFTSPQFINLVKADTDLYRRKFDSKSVKKTLTIPSWLNYEAEEANVNFSGVLQNALMDYLKLSK